MKMQLPPPNNFSTANSRPPYSAQPQRQGAIVDKSLEDFVRNASTKHPELATEFDAVVKRMIAVTQNSRIGVSQGKKTGILTFRTWPETPRIEVKGVRYDWAQYPGNLDGKGILNMLNEQCEHLDRIDRGPYPPIDPDRSVFIHD